MSALHPSNEHPRVYILGGGAVGMALAVSLSLAGREVCLVRIRKQAAPTSEWQTVTLTDGHEGHHEVELRVMSLDALEVLDGLIVVTAKAHANAAIADALATKQVRGKIVIMQNGLGVEAAWASLKVEAIYRCVLYVTGQKASENEVLFRFVASSPIGLARGTATGLEEAVAALHTPIFPFHVEDKILEQIWSKTILNAVFNSICPLLDADNGIFVRDAQVLELGRQIVGECLVLARCYGVSLTEAALMERLLAISQGSKGVLISTLQDLRCGRQTEMQHLNLELARLAEAAHPPVDLGRTSLLGRLVLAKSRVMESERQRAR